MTSSLPPYPSLTELEAELQRLGTVQTYGSSVDGRPLWVVEAGGEGPRVVVTAGLHGPEWIGVQVALEVLRRGPIEGTRLAVLPVLNPDGYAHTDAAVGDAPLGMLRKNARGVDLNRNFPLPWGARPSRVPFAGASDLHAATYRGPSPLSEPETEALAAWMRDDPPHASVNLHSFMGTLLPARVWHPADWLGYRRLTRAFRHTQGGLAYPRLSTPVFDVFTGELEDWQHHTLGCWAVCVECFSVAASLRQHLRAPSVFWRFNPRDPAPVVARDAPAVRALLAAAAREPRPPQREQGVRQLPAW